MQNQACATGGIRTGGATRGMSSRQVRWRSPRSLACRWPRWRWPVPSTPTCCGEGSPACGACYLTCNVSCFASAYKAQVQARWKDIETQDCTGGRRVSTALKHRHMSTGNYHLWRTPGREADISSSGLPGERQERSNLLGGSAVPLAGQENWFRDFPRRKDIYIGFL